MWPKAEGAKQADMRAKGRSRGNMNLFASWPATGGGPEPGMFSAEQGHAAAAIGITFAGISGSSPTARSLGSLSSPCGSCSGTNRRFRDAHSFRNSLRLRVGYAIRSYRTRRPDDITRRRVLDVFCRRCALRAGPSACLKWRVTMRSSNSSIEFA
jgi:hypothetical protein